MRAKSRITRQYAGMIAIAAVYLILAVFPIAALYAQENKSMNVASSPPRVEIPGSQLQKITSAIVGQEYDLYIHLPRNYGSKDQKHPVLFLLDAQWDFPLVTAIFGQQFYDGFLPGLVIVGITWGGKNPNYDSLRARDLTPNNVAPLRQSGGAPKFLAFIKNELIPFIDSKYLVSDDRTLMGSSFGGLFTLYALFNETKLFQRYVLTSPAVGWANEGIYTFEKKLCRKEIPASGPAFYGGGRAGRRRRFSEIRGSVENAELPETLAANPDTGKHWPFRHESRRIYQRVAVCVRTAVTEA